MFLRTGDTNPYYNVLYIKTEFPSTYKVAARFCAKCAKYGTAKILPYRVI